MKVRQKLALKLFPLITLFSIATNALASCPTMQQGPPCLEFWRTEAVFIGLATRVVQTPNTTGLALGPYVRTTVYFSIEEAFKGVSGAVIVINLDHCGYLFKENERYLVYAYRNRNNNELDVRAGNTRTRPLAEAGEDLEYIRVLSAAAPGSRVFGKVVLHDHNLKAGYKAELLQDTKVTLEGNNQRQEVVTDSEGRYEFKGIPGGPYQLRAEIPAYLKYDEQPIKLNGRDCLPVDIHVTRKGQIAGRVFDMNGKPLGSVPVTIAPADVPFEEIEKKSWLMGFTDREGRYSFAQLAPGRYMVIINHESDRSIGSQKTRALPRLFYPGVSDLGGATVIVVGKEHVPREYNFQLPIQ